MRLTTCAAVCAALLLPPVAANAQGNTQSVTPDQAQALRQQLQDWLAGLLGPTVKLPALPLRIEAAQDHYKLTWPISGLEGGGDAAVTASLKPLDGGRWSLDDVTGPPSGKLTVTMPDTPGLPPAGPLKLAFTVGHQDSKGVIDPSLATGSTVHSEVRDVSVVADSATQHQEQRFERWVMDSSLKPGKDGRLDFVTDTTMDGWRSAAKLSTGTPVAIGMQTMHAVGEVDGVNRDRVGALIGALGGLFGALPDDVMEKGAKADIPPAAMAQLHVMALALPDMLASVSMEETMDGVQVEIEGMGGMTLKHFLFGFGGEAPDGKLHTWVDIGLDGLDSPTLPPKIAAYLPRHFEIKPSFSGIQMADVAKLALDATDGKPDDDRLEPDMAAVLSHGGATLGIDALSFDLGPARFSGTGRATMQSPDDWVGAGKVTATGLDDLVNQAQDNPDLAEAVPFLIMLRGLAKPEGDHLMWQIASEGDKLTVNGMDLSALSGGGDKPHGKKRQPTKP